MVTMVTLVGMRRSGDDQHACLKKFESSQESHDFGLRQLRALKNVEASWHSHMVGPSRSKSIVDFPWKTTFNYLVLTPSSFSPHSQSPVRVWRAHACTHVRTRAHTLCSKWRHGWTSYSEPEMQGSQACGLQLQPPIVRSPLQP